MVPTLIENFKYLFVNFFCKIKLVNPHIPHQKKEIHVASCLAINYRLKKVKYPLHFVVSYVQPVTQHYESRTVQKAPLKVATMKNTDDFCYKGNPSHATTKSALFAVSKDE